MKVNPKLTAFIVRNWKF